MARTHNLTPNAQYWDSLSIDQRRDLKKNNRSYAVFDDDDPFWDEYNKLNPLYRSQLDPYLRYNYQPGLGDWLGNVFGVSTGEDKMRMQAQQKARDILAGLNSDVFTNSYDSQQEQAARQRDAGLNPDLAGEAEGEPASTQEQPLQPLDMSIFEPPTELISDIGSLFVNAATGVNSIGAFLKSVADIRNIKAATSSVEISNLNDAFDYAGKYLSAFDPATRIDFGDVEVTPDFFNQKMQESVSTAFKEDHPGMNETTRALVDRAMKARLRDPAVMDQFYNNYTKAVKSKLNKVASDKTFNKVLDLPDEVIYKQNDMYLDYMGKAMKNAEAYNALISDYNIQKTKNDFDYEAWKYTHHVPEKIAEADLAFYLRTIAEHDANQLKYTYQKQWLDYLWSLKEKGDPAAIYLVNAMLQGGYSPLLSTSASGGLFGIKGSGTWNNFITPEMTMPQNGLTRKMGPTSSLENNPFGWIDNK